MKKKNFQKIKIILLKYIHKSLFEDEKYNIKRATDKIFSLIEISLSNLDDILIIIDSDNLEKSKLNPFLKNKSNVCTAFYPDNEKRLMN